MLHAVPAISLSINIACGFNHDDPFGNDLIEKFGTQTPSPRDLYDWFDDSGYTPLPVEESTAAKAILNILYFWQ